MTPEREEEIYDLIDQHKTRIREIILSKKVSQPQFTREERKELDLLELKIEELEDELCGIDMGETIKDPNYVGSQEHLAFDKCKEFAIDRAMKRAGKKKSFLRKVKDITITIGIGIALIPVIGLSLLLSEEFLDDFGDDW